MLRTLERICKRLLVSVLRLFLGSRRTPLPPGLSFRSILVIRQHNQLGDMLCVVPLLRALRAAFPAARLSLLASPVNEEVMRHHRYLDELIVYDKREFLQRGIRCGRVVRFVRDLRARAFDCAIVTSTVSTSFTSDMLAFLCGAPVRIGPGRLDGKQNSSSFFFTLPVDLDWSLDPHRHQTLRNLDIAEDLGVTGGDLHTELTLTPEEETRGALAARNAMEGRRMAIAVHPGAGKPPNRWPADRFARIANVLAREFDAMVLVTSGPMDEEPVELMKRTLEIPYHIIRDTPIRQVAAILAHVDLLIAADTGIMHVGAGAGTPVLSLFGPTDPLQWAPIASKNRYIHSRDGRMESIPVEEVLETARAMLVRATGRE